MLHTVREEFESGVCPRTGISNDTNGIDYGPQRLCVVRPAFADLTRMGSIGNENSPNFRAVRARNDEQLRGRFRLVKSISP